MSLSCQDIVARLRAMANADNVAGMARYGINPEGTLGVSIPTLRRLAREAGRDHALALALWDTGIHEARILASLVDVPDLIDEAQMERWAADLDSWDVCDQCCNNLLRRTRHAHDKARQWAGRPETFVKRAGFTLMACLAVHDKQADDAVFLDFLDLVRREADDERNFVKKAVNWALRGIGKRNAPLHAAALALAGDLVDGESRAARWIGRDAFREMNSEKTRNRILGQPSR